MKSLFIDPEDDKILLKLRKLKPTRGYCIFIDIVGSTKIKDSSLENWVILIRNTFLNVKSHLSSSWPPIKCIGDALMFFIPDNLFDNYTPSLQLYDNLYSIVSKKHEAWHKPIKISFVRCIFSHGISFMKNTRDIYGKDIDLAARLLETAGENEIIMNDLCYNKIQGAYKKLSPRNKKPYTQLMKRTMGPWFVNLKGFDNPICIFKLPNYQAELTEKHDVY